MGDSTKSESESSDDEEYIPPACEEESPEDSEDEVSDDEVGAGTSVKKGNKPLEEKDRDEIWTDFLKGTNPVAEPEQCLSCKSHVEPNSRNPLKERVAGLGLKRSAPSTGGRLADALKRLKSSTLSSGVPKISVLEKSRLDWESFTEKEGIKDDLKLHNKGKNGYVERKAFEARTQEREYQILKEARLKSIQRR
ncbi:Craniofacial development protein 1 [Taenia solium]|eukprot:TsM_000329200 transcript=TsM_000329200 gene=TsM_000329200